MSHAAGAAPDAARPGPERAAATAAAGAAAQTRSRTVMLMTGDRVVYSVGADGRPTVVIQPAPRPGAQPVFFTTSGQGEHLYVIPSDATARVAANALDKSLFDIPLLIRDGQASAEEPAGLIVRYRRGTAAPTDSGTLPGGRSGATLKSLNGAAVRVQRGRAPQLWAAMRAGGPGARTLGRGIERVWLDSTVRASLDVSVIQIGAPTAWFNGFQGQGVKVAVLDTGIDTSHPDFQGRIVSSANFTSETSVLDGNGHGTHVASIVAGSGAGSDGKFKGVAPAASLMIGKVLNSAGQGPMSQVIAGMEWAARNGAKVISLSLSDGRASDGSDPADQAVDALSAETGALFVIAAGNNNGAASIGSPGAASSALTVGATDKLSGFAPYSNTGPRRGDAAVKPEITAPGTGITAARAAGTSLGTPYNASYTTASGTSMATPHVAGAAVLLAQAHPTWTSARIKDALVSTAADPVNYTVFQGGSGLVDVRRAFTQGVFGPEALDLGAVPAPYTGVRTRPVTYSNDTSAAVTLQLAVAGQGYDGRALPAGAVAASPSTLTVPAGGTATATLSVDPSPGDPGVYGGVVIATTSDGAVRLRSPFSYYKTAGHKLSVPVLDSRGNPAVDTLVTLARLDGATNANDPLVAQSGVLITGEQGRVDTYVPDGTYDLYSVVFEWDATVRRLNHVVSLEVPVHADTTVTLDARQTRRVNPVLPESTNTLLAMTGTLRELPDGQQLSSGGAVPWENYDVYVSQTAAPRIGWFDAFEQWTLGSSQVQVRANGTLLPVEYHPYLNGRKLAQYTNSTLPLVSAGTGTPAELSAAQASGKVVLVRIAIPAGTTQTGGYAWNAIEAARQNAEAAGAAGLITYLDVTDGKPMQVHNDLLLQLSLPAAAGRQVQQQLAAGSVQLQVTGGRANPEHVYQLRFQHTDGIPATAPTVDPAQLVSYRARYRADQADLTYALGWPVLGEHDRSGGTLAVGFWAPMDWTEYVGPRDNRLTWARAVFQRANWDAPVAAQLESRDIFGTGTTGADEDWFGPPIRLAPPEPSDGYPFKLRCSFCREGNTFVAGKYQTDSDPRHYAVTDGAGASYRLFRDGAEILPGATSPYRFTLPATPGSYRLDAVETQPGLGTVRTLAARTSTSWTFQSAPPTTSGPPAGLQCPISSADTASCAFQPLIQPHYQLNLDLLNRAEAGTTFTFDVLATPHRLTPGAAPASTLTLSTSTNGGSSWQPAQVTALGSGRFRVTVTHPTLAGTDGYVWLRTQASDPAGNAVSQTVERAYALRAPAAPAPSCQVKYTPNSWNNGFTAEVQITNLNSTAINGWTLSWVFANDQRITNAWNGVATQTGQQVSVKNVASNAAIAPHGTVSFGFQGTHGGTNTAPDAFSLNGLSCARQ